MSSLSKSKSRSKATTKKTKPQDAVKGFTILKKPTSLIEESEINASNSSVHENKPVSSNSNESNHSRKNNVDTKPTDIKLLKSNSIESKKIEPKNTAVSLLDTQYQFSPEKLLPLLKDSVDFTIIGVIGKTGLGKSTLMSDLCGWDSANPFESSMPPFPLQSVRDRINASHKTRGIDVFVSPERVIVLDTQPILCATTQSPPGLEFRLMAFLLGVCHVVVVLDGSANNGKTVLTTNFNEQNLNAKKPVENTNSKGQSEQKEPQDKQSMHSSTAIGGRGAANGNYVGFGGFGGGLYKALRVAELLLQGIPSIAFLRDGMSAAHPLDSLPSDANTAASIRSSISGLPEHIATAVFVFTKVARATMESWTQASSAHNCDLIERKLAVSMAGSRLWKATKLSPKESAENSEQETDEEFDSRYTVLPRRPTRRDDAEWPCYAEAIDSYRQLVFSVRRKSFGNSNRFSELDWLKNAEILWKMLESSPLVKDFRTTIQKLS